MNKKETTDTYRNLESKVKSELEFHSVKHVIAGISGGADSVALLRALKSLGIKVLALHCNFHLRGAESDRDMNFVVSLCHDIGVELIIRHFDVAKHLSEHGGSVEMACRDLRYAEFRNMLRESGADRIAVAHNADDQAETVMLNLMRGSGVSGLRGMLPDTGEIIRPLLGVSRAEIETYLAEIKQDFITDSTNLSSDFRRNFIRNEVIPLLETRWPEARKSLCRTATIMRQEEKILDVAEAGLTGDEENLLTYDNILSAPDPLWLIRRFVIGKGGIGSQALEILRALKNPEFQSGKIWHVSKGRISMERHQLEFISDADDISGHGIDIDSLAINMEKDTMTEVKRSPLTCLWTSLKPEDIIFRHPEKGDRILPLGMTGSILVSKVMKDCGLSQAQKESTVVAVDKSNGAIIWIAGLKRSRLHLVRENTPIVYRYSVNPHDK